MTVTGTAEAPEVEARAEITDGGFDYTRIQWAKQEPESREEAASVTDGDQSEQQPPIGD